MMFRLILLSACIAFCGACSCVEYDFPDALCFPSILFRGAAIEEGTEGKEPEQPTNPNMMYIRYRYYTRVFTVRVDQAFRMPPSLMNNQTITIKTSSSGGLCGRGFTLNEDTLFAAYMRQSGEVRTDMCSPNARWNYLSATSQQLLESNGLPQYCANLDTNTGNRFLVSEVRPVLATQP